jgi:NAD(P)-dependent dehydrogenase (short-subunit alcohol dehydrogenase family)
VSTNLFDLKDKVALVTGASRGIGEEIAKLLAQQGAHVIVSSRKLDDCEAVASEIRKGGAMPNRCHGTLDTSTILSS